MRKWGWLKVGVFEKWIRSNRKEERGERGKGEKVKKWKKGERR